VGNWKLVLEVTLYTIPAAGVEPARPCGHWILSSNSMFLYQLK